MSLCHTCTGCGGQKKGNIDFDLLRFALDNIPGTLLVCDCDQRVIYHNKVVCSALAIDADRLLGATLDELIADGYIINSASKKAFDTKKVAIEYVRNPTEMPILTMSTPILSDDGEVCLVVALSISEALLEIISKEMIDARTQLQHTIAFLSNVISLNNDIVAESPQMKSLFSLLSRIAPMDSAVLLNGETGTGKEVLAKYIHSNSSRKSGVFIPINCASVPENLMESEFFGYEDGAFTGARKGGKTGIFELANCGTLFLDEIGEMPLAIQSKFLRVIETGVIRRLGSEKSINVNFRLIAATNRDLEEMCKNGSFRLDLYYRLNIISATIPPLRERVDDIEPLANMFLRQCNKKYNTSKILSRSVIETIKAYKWPGNVRELRNLIERLVLISNSDIIYSIPELQSLSSAHADSSAESRAADACMAYNGSLKKAVKAYERQIIEDVVTGCEGNIAKAADMLDIHKSVLYRKLESYKKNTQ